MRIEQCIVTKSNQDGSNRLIFSPRESLFELRRDACDLVRGKVGEENF